MNRDLFQNILNEAGGLLKFKLPQLDEQGEGSFGLRKNDVSIVVNVQYFEETNEAVFYATLPVSQTDEEGDIAVRLLERNARSASMGGAVYAMMSESDAIVLQMKFNCSETSGTSLAKSLLAFLKEVFS